MPPPMTGIPRSHRDEIRELPGIPVEEIPRVLREPPPSNTGGSLGVYDPFGAGSRAVARNGGEASPARSANVTPLFRFAVLLIIFALAVSFLPKGARIWFVAVIILGALNSSPGAITDFKEWMGL